MSVCLLVCEDCEKAFDIQIPQQGLFGIGFPKVIIGNNTKRLHILLRRKSHREVLYLGGGKKGRCVT